MGGVGRDGEAWGSMKARYGFVPTVPVQVEMYGSRQQFSVRTSGLPNIGIQGVCFGRVVAAISPKAEPFDARPLASLVVTSRPLASVGAAPVSPAG